MTSSHDPHSQRLADLGARIEQMMKGLKGDDLMHSTERQRAADLKVEHARLVALAKAKREGSPNPERDAVLAAEVEALHVDIEKWIAGIDKQA